MCVDILIIGYRLQATSRYSINKLKWYKKSANESITTLSFPLQKCNSVTIHSSSRDIEDYSCNEMLGCGDYTEVHRNKYLHCVDYKIYQVRDLML